MATVTSTGKKKPHITKKLQQIYRDDYDDTFNYQHNNRILQRTGPKQPCDIDFTNKKGYT